MSDPLRYILVGAGGQRAHWCRLVLPELQKSNRAVCVAAVDTNPDRLINAQTYLGVAAEFCFTDPVDAFERRRADFALLAVPPRDHEKLVNLALTYDLNILMEAPIAPTMEGSLRIYRKCRHDRKKVAVATSPRYEQDKFTLERLVRSNRYGRVNYIVSRFAENHRKSPSWGKYRHEMDDPLLIEAGMHHLDVFRALAGESARSVYAVSWNPPWGEYRGDSTALVTLEMANGIHCFYEGAKANATFLNRWGEEYFRVECEQATLELDRGSIRVISGGATDAPRLEDVPMLERPSWGNTWLAEMFCDWLTGGIEPPNTISDNIRYATMVFAAVASARSGRPVDVKDYLRQKLDAPEAR